MAANFSDGICGFHRPVAERVVDVHAHVNLFVAVQKAFQLVLILSGQREHRYIEIRRKPKNARVSKVHALAFESTLAAKDGHCSVFGDQSHEITELRKNQHSILPFFWFTLGNHQDDFSGEFGGIFCLCIQIENVGGHQFAFGARRGS